MQELVKRLQELLNTGTLRVVHEEGRDQTAYAVELNPAGEIIIWVE